MNIFSLLEYSEKEWLMEVDVTSLKKSDFNVIYKFIKELGDNIEFDDSLDIGSITTHKIVGAIDSLRHSNVRQKIASGSNYSGEDPVKRNMSGARDASQVAGARSQQALAHGFGPSGETDQKLSPRSIAIATAVATALDSAGVYSVERAQFTDKSLASFISDFIATTGGTSPFDLLEKSRFNKAINTFYQKKVSRVTKPSDASPEGQDVSNMDVNSFVFLTSLANARKRGKQSWDSYLNSKTLSTANKYFSSATLNKEEAASNLASLGFLDEINGGYTPNWDKIETFKSNILSQIVNIVESGLKILHPSKKDGDEFSRSNKAIEQYKIIMNAVRKHLPHELYRDAKTKALGAIRKTVESGRGNLSKNPDAKNAILKYLQSLETDAEYDGPVDGLGKEIQTVIDTIAVKIVANQIHNLLKPSADQSKLNLSTDMRALGNRLRKYFSQ